MQETDLRGALRAQNAKKSGAQKPTAPAETLVRAFVMQETALRGAPRAQNAEKSGAQKPTAPAETLFREFVMQETALRRALRAQKAEKSGAQPRAKSLSAEKEFEHPKNMRALPSARAFSLPVTTFRRTKKATFLLGQERRQQKSCSHFSANSSTKRAFVRRKYEKNKLLQDKICK